jgi:hypothetical protein
MRFIAIFLLIVFSTLKSNGQHLLTTVKSKELISSVESFALGDSLFLMCNTNYSVQRSFGTIIITPDGTVDSLDLPELRKESVFSTINLGDNIHIYFLEKDKVRVLTFDKRNGHKE